MLIACTLAVVLGSVNLLSAQENFPLVPGEKVLDKRTLAKDKIDLFTDIKGQVYKKTFALENGDWKVVESKSILLRKTGLKTDGPVKRRDPELGRSIESKLRAQGFSLDNLPDKLDLSQSPFLPPVGDQQENSCVGWSTGYYLRTYQQAREIGWQVRNGNQRVDTHVFSPTFIYNQINNGEDNGAYLEDAGNLLQVKGAATLANFPYVAGDYFTVPSGEVIQKAAPHKIKEWKVLFTAYDSSDFIIQKTKEYLNTGDLLVAGSQAGVNFLYPESLQDGTSIILTDDYVIGGHAYVIVGYDDNMFTPEGTGAFKVLSSWGEGWGNRGFSYITYQAFTANIIEGYVFTDLVNEPDKVEDLPTLVKDKVNFNIDFSGSGKYDIVVRDLNQQLLSGAQNLQANGEGTEVEWPGIDYNGVPAPNGTYRLIITTYEGDTPITAYDNTFAKQSRVSGVKAQAYSLFDIIQQVDVSMTPLTGARVSVKVNDAGSIKTIMENLPVNPTEKFQYAISREMFDFNKTDLSKVTIEVEVK
ncbi:MAG: C1 family peptidase [Eubacteriales bacterium]